MRERQFLVKESFIKKAWESACDEWRDLIEQEIPEAFFNINNWYVNKNESVFCCNNINDKRGHYVTGYGMCGNQYIHNKLNPYYFSSKDLRQATPKEIKKGLVNGAIQKGLVEGAILQNWALNGYRRIKGDYELRLDDTDFDVMLLMDGFVLFRDGEWAKLPEEDILEHDGKLYKEIKVN